MKLWTVILVLALALVACQPKAEPAQEPAEQTEPADTLTTEETAVMALVENAVASMLQDGQTEEGRKDVFARFEDPEGAFVQGDYYLFVYNLEGTVIAHEAQPELIGRNLLEKTDANGVKMIAEMVRIAQEQGSGWVDYLWPFPGTGEVMPKRAYVARPGSMEMFIGCGFYPSVDK